MKFKPKIKVSWKRVLAVTQIACMLATTCLASLPQKEVTQAATAKSEGYLEDDMPAFMEIGGFEIIKTNGEWLRKMFPSASKSIIKDKSQYIAYVSIDKLRSSAHSWRTQKQYWHSTPWTDLRVPSKASDGKNKDVLFKYTPGETPTAEKGKIDIKAGTKYRYGKDASWKYVPSGKIGTLHYFCTDEGTKTGDAFIKLQNDEAAKDVSGSNEIITFYISPVIQCSEGHCYYSCSDWYNHSGIGWSDRNWSNYTSHYNREVRIKLPSVKVISRAQMIGKQMDTSMDTGNAVKLATDIAVALTDKRYLRSITKNDYIFAPTKDTLLDAKGVTNPVTTYRPFCDKSYTVENPVTQKWGNRLPEITDETGKKKKLMCVGYRVKKDVIDKNGDNHTIVVAAEMVELKKGANGGYIPYYAEEKAGENTEFDKSDDGEALTLPRDLNDRTVTVMRYDRYKKTKFGVATPETTFKRGQKCLVEKWKKESVKAVNWANSDDFGIRNTADERTKIIYVDWLYAPVDDDTETKVVLEQYYTTENENFKTTENPSVDDSKDLEYKHNNGTTPATPVKRTLLATVEEGNPWVSYSVKQTKEGAYKLKDGTTVPKATKGAGGKLSVSKSDKVKFKDKKPKCAFTKDDLIENKNSENSIAPSKIPLVLHKDEKDSNSLASNNYLYKVVIKTSHTWTQFTAADIWGSNVTTGNAKIGKKYNDRSYLTKAPYMQEYVKISGSIPLQLRALKSDWQQDAYNMTHFIIPEVRGIVTIKAYYTSTLPVKTMVYKKTGGTYVLDDSQTKMNWVSSGKTLTGTYTGGGTLTAAFAAVGKHTASRPYSYKNYKKASFRSETAAEKYYPTHTDMKLNNTTYTVKVKDRPIVIILLVDDSPGGKYFTQVQYVYTPSDGQYHFVKSWKQSITTLYGQSKMKYHHTDDEYKWDTKKKEWVFVRKLYTYMNCPARTVRAFVSFPQYVAYDDGNTGLYGSIYEARDIWFDYSGKSSFPTATTSKQGIYSGSNNSQIYLTEKGHLAQQDTADITPGGDNSLVVYCYYYDAIDETWDPYNPNTKTKEFKSEKEKAITWNWELPEGFVWENVDITSKDTADVTQYGDEFTNDFKACVLGTQASAVFNAQDGIPSTDRIRAEAEVPRYLTKGYWNRISIDWAVKIVQTYVTQHKSTKRIMSGENCPDHYDLNSCIDNCMHCQPAYCTYDYYTSEPLQKSTQTEVKRSSVYYTLGDAEVWDPLKVTMKNDVFSDSAVSSNDLITMYGNGVIGGYESNARFFKTGDGSYDLPSYRTKRPVVNYGTFNDWETDEDPDDIDTFEKDANSIVGDINVKNDTVSFYNGLGKTFMLSDGTAGKGKMAQVPSFPPEADFTFAGIFDTYNNVPEGIVIKPQSQNGHHETASIAYYKQVQCIPTNQYRTMDLIKTKIADDDDDDVLVYTPTVNESSINLDFNKTERGADGISLYPNDNYDQSITHDMSQNMSNIQLDREYTMTLSVCGDASDLDGYGYQDYVRYLALDKYGNPYTQVRFPFPVQMVVRYLENGELKTDDRYYYADTWIDIEMIDEKGKVTGEINQTFFVPSWATEKETANIKFRSIAINADTHDKDRKFENVETNDAFIDKALTESGRHNAAEERDYVAWREENDTVTGRISNFEIIDVTDYPAWQSVFRKLDPTEKKFTNELIGRSYRSGLCNEFGFVGKWGSLFTAPIVGTSNPASPSPGTLGLGYKIRYKMTTVGPYYNQSDAVTFKPKFYYVNDKGEYLQTDGSYSSSLDTRQEVNVYYGETVNGKRYNLVKVGSPEDSMNRKFLNLSDEEWSITPETIKKTNDILNTTNVGRESDSYTFNKTTLHSEMRLIAGDEHISAHRGKKLASAADTAFAFNKKTSDILKAVEEKPNEYVGTHEESLAEHLKLYQVQRSVQEWYGEYYLPSDTYVTTKSWDTIKKQITTNFTGKESCWLQGGRLVISFNPEVHSETKQTLRYNVENQLSLESDGKTIYSYYGCNQFVVENGVTAKRLLDGSVISLKPGDVLIYDFKNGDKDRNKAPSAKNAYSSSGSH